MIEIGHVRDDDPASRAVVTEQAYALVEDLHAQMDAELEAKKRADDTLHRKLWGFYDDERQRQRHNRHQMAMDEDYFDSLQWTDEEIDELVRRGQSPTVYNLIKPTALWMIGTEVRTRMDHKVAPREQGDEKTAEVKTKFLKYLDDVNREKWHRSRAFREQIIAGLGWLECQASDDPTKERVVTGSESWKNVIRDSLSVKPDLEDARYLFRQRVIDLDVACQMFPDQKQDLEEAANKGSDITDDWYLGQRVVTDDWPSMREVGKYQAIDRYSQFRTNRKRVLIVEAWYRVPVNTEVVVGGSMHGAPYNENDPWMAFNKRAGMIQTRPQFTMQMRHAFFTEKGMLLDEQLPYRHNSFPLTPCWGYRRGRDGEPYGVVRELRSPQDDLNKRMSKAIWRTSANQVIAEKGAVPDVDAARDEVARPDGYIETLPGKKFEIREQQGLASGDIELVQIDMNMIERMGPVNGDNLGADTQAQSGKAIRFRQEQGSLMSQMLFDNLRLAVQIHGEKKLSLAEQYVTEEKVIRITEEKGKFDWVPVNQPQENPDGSITYLNDMIASKGDFILDEQDFRATVREAMADQLTQLMGGLPPDLAAILLPAMLELQDIPDKENLLSKIKAKLGMEDEDDPAAARIKDMQAQFEQEMAAREEEFQKERDALKSKLDVQDNRIETLEGQLLQAKKQSVVSQIKTAETTAVAHIKEQQRAVKDAAQEQDFALRQHSANLETARFEREGQAAHAEEGSQIDMLIKALPEIGKAIKELNNRINQMEGR